MATTVQLRTRVNRDLKRKSDKLLAELGLDAGTYVSMALAQLVNRRGIPFAVMESDEDYFAREYDLSRDEMQAAGERMKREASGDRKAGRLRTVTSAKDLLP